MFGCFECVMSRLMLLAMILHILDLCWVGLHFLGVCTWSVIYVTFRWCLCRDLIGAFSLDCIGREWVMVAFVCATCLAFGLSYL